MDSLLADGMTLRASWDRKLSDTLQLFKHLLSSSPDTPSSSSSSTNNSWKDVKVSSPSPSSPSPLPSAKLSSPTNLSSGLGVNTTSSNSNRQGGSFSQSSSSLTISPNDAPQVITPNPSSTNLPVNNNNGNATSTVGPNIKSGQRDRSFSINSNTSTTGSDLYPQFHSSGFNASTLSEVQPSAVTISKRALKGFGEVHRATLEIRLPTNNSDLSEASISVDRFASILNIPENRVKWDGLVSASEVVECLDGDTRIERSVYKLGWPMK